MKRILSICVVILMIFSSAVAVNAESNLSSTLNVMYAYDVAEDEITIIANFIDITAEEGIIGVEYDVKYDPKVLELVKAEPIYPEAWDTLIGSGVIEDLSGHDSDGVYHWSFVVIALGYGIKDDNELGIRLEFKPLKKESTKVEFVYDDIISEVVENGMTLDLLHVAGSNATISIDFDDSNVSSEVSDTESETSSEASDTESETSSEVSDTESETSSEASDTESGTSSEVSDTESETSSEVSGTESDGSSVEDASSIETSDNSPSDDVIQLPSIKVDITDADVDTSNNVSENDGENNWLTWVLVIIGIAVVATIVIALVNSKKRK